MPPQPKSLTSPESRVGYKMQDGEKPGATCFGNVQDSPYINGWNFPGLSAAACDKLIEIEDRMGVRINGVAMDNIGIDSGENSAGPKGDLVTDSWHCHVRGLQRGWKFVENAANLGQLAEAKLGSCSLFVGAPKLVGGTGGPSRVMALCKR